MDMAKGIRSIAVNGNLLARLLAKYFVIQQEAIDDPDGYDGGSVLGGVFSAAEEYSTSQTTALIAEVERLNWIVKASEDGCYKCQHPKEVERLTAERDGHRADVVRLREERQQLLSESILARAERDRYKAALEERIVG